MATETTTERCGADTSTGKCMRPSGHNPKTGHASAQRLKSRSKASTLTPEQMQAKETERAAAAKARIKEAKAAHVAKVAKLQEAAKALGFNLVKIEAEATEDAAE